MQNGCLVLTRGDSEFNAAKTGSDGALIFNAYQKTDAEGRVTSIEGTNAEGVSIVAVAVDGEEAVKAIVK